MSRRFFPMAAFVAAAVLTGCGADERPASTSADSVAKVSPSAPAAPLRVGVTDARVGDATTATADGLVELKVPKQKVDPRAVARRKERRDGVGAGDSCQDVSIMPTADNLAVVEAATLCLLNGERADAGIGPLATNVRLAESALAHTNDMIANSYFAHSGRDGSDVVARIRRAGYIVADAAWTVGENLAWGTGALATPTGIVDAWMNSQGHRENILSASYREIGFGIAIGNPRANDGQGATYTTNFGSIEAAESQGAAVETKRSAAPSNVAGTRTTTSAAAKRRARAKCRAMKGKSRKARARKARCMRRAARAR